MEFFKQLSEIATGLDLSIRIKEKNGKLTISVLPDNVGQIQPLLITGTPEDLDQGFMEAIRKPMEATKLVVANKEQYEKDLQEVDKENKEDSEIKNKPAAKPASKPATAPTKKLKSKKPDEKKKTEEPEDIKVDEPAGPQQLTIG